MAATSRPEPRSAGPGGDRDGGAGGQPLARAGRRRSATSTIAPRPAAEHRGDGAGSAPRATPSSPSGTGHGAPATARGHRQHCTPARRARGGYHRGIVSPVTTVTVRVPAKVNLQLAVGPVRADGYHDVATVYHAVSLFDR